MKKLRNKNPFTAVPNALLNDNTISFKSKGIYSYLLSKSDGWIFFNQSILKETKEGLSSFQSGVKDLIQSGWLIKTQIILDNGRFGGNEFELMTDLPQAKNSSTVTHKKSEKTRDFPSTEKPSTENRHPYKEITKKEIINKEIINKIYIHPKKSFINLTIVGITDCDNVQLEQKQYDKLVTDYNTDLVRTQIIQLDGYLEDHPKKYKSHYKALRSWLLKESKTKGGNNKYDSVYEHNAKYLKSLENL